MDGSGGNGDFSLDKVGGFVEDSSCFFVRSLVNGFSNQNSVFVGRVVVLKVLLGIRRNLVGEHNGGEIEFRVFRSIKRFGGFFIISSGDELFGVDLLSNILVVVGNQFVFGIKGSRLVVVIMRILFVRFVLFSNISVVFFLRVFFGLFEESLSIL